MADIYLGNLNTTSSIRNYLALATNNLNPATVITSSTMEMTTGNGSELRLSGNFSSPDQSEWEVFSVSLSQDGINLVAISDIALAFSDFQELSPRDLVRELLDGNDRITSGSVGDLSINLRGGDDHVELGGGNDRILGGSGNDTVLGRDGNDELVGGIGFDHLEGGNGSDHLDGGNGADYLTGGRGHDTVRGGNGEDSLFGAGGRDHLSGGKGDDTLTGGNGADTFVFRRNDGSDVITDFEVGRDHIEIVTGASGMSGVDFSQAGDDVLVYFGNVTLTVENTTVDLMNSADNFLF